MTDLARLKNALAQTPLFAGKSWKISAGAWNFSADELEELRAIGTAALAFYRALERLYLASAEGKSLLRNRKLFAPWVAEILDRGKPSRLVAHARARALRGTFPPVIRPDLLITENGFALTELDSVPGGIGLTAFLENLYLGASEIPQLFLSALGGRRVVAAVSDEAAEYRPEFEWLATQLPAGAFSVCHPDELEIRADVPEGGVFFAGEKVDVVWRFFELFDFENLRNASALADAAERGLVSVGPPMRAFQEEKMSLALFRHPALAEFWRESLGEENFRVFEKIVPASWIVEPVENLPATATLLAPKPLRDWCELASFPRRERNLVLKASGFSPEAWGARSVSVGADVSAEEWARAVARAIESARRGSLYVLQEFRKPSRVEHEFFSPNGKRVSADGRARICPYYFVENGVAQLGGALATICPADKKIIHGMSSAVLAPCAFSRDSADLLREKNHDF